MELIFVLGAYILGILVLFGFIIWDTCTSEMRASNPIVTTTPKFKVGDLLYIPDFNVLRIAVEKPTNSTYMDEWTLDTLEYLDELYNVRIATDEDIITWLDENLEYELRHKC